MERRGFGELELSILKIVREAGRVTVRDVYASLGKAGSYTTIMTVMSRLAEKGELKREKEGKQYVYWGTATQSKVAKGILKRLQEKIFGGEKLALVSYLLETEQKITNSELDEIEKLIKKRRQENKEHG